jgi:hypothetical protein
VVGQKNRCKEADRPRLKAYDPMKVAGGIARLLWAAFKVAARSARGPAGRRLRKEPKVDQSGQSFCPLTRWPRSSIEAPCLGFPDGAFKGCRIEAQT